MAEAEPKKGNFKVSREEWIAAARDALIREGVNAVKIERLAFKLGVTRGGFYWFFKGRQQLLDALLADWQTTNTQAFIDAIRDAGPDGQVQFRAMIDIYLNEDAFSPAYDAAVRDWARTSQTARRAVEATDDQRINLMAGVFRVMGYDTDEAFIRARVTYFHQVGYYAMGIKEDRETRERYRPLYTKILAGPA
ncbi:MAG: TetR/AcrR family transcriptional regulator [Sphingomonadales bacterium]